MSRLVDLVNNNPKKFVLVSSLIRNGNPWAEIARRAGADASKIHLSIGQRGTPGHPATDYGFGNIAEERKNIQATLDAFEGPVIVVPGPQRTTSQGLQTLNRMGIDCWDAYWYNLPQGQFREVKMGRMVAFKLDTIPKIGTTPEQVQELVHEKKADLLECSLFPRERYRQSPTAEDFRQWERYAKITAPKLISTELAIKPEQVQTLYDMGYRGILTGAVVTGVAPEKVEAVTLEFRNAIDRLG